MDRVVVAVMEKENKVEQEDSLLDVYPVAIETDDDIPEFRTDDESIVVRIDKIDDNESDEVTNNNNCSSMRPKSGFGSLVTAIRIAHWMAKAYGYVAEKKSLYAAQDTVIY